MNLRRYALFLIVAMLTFVIGLASAALISRVNPFTRVQESHKGCRRLSALPGPKRSMTVYTVYRSDGTVVKAYEVDKTYGLERLGEATGETPAAPPPPPVVTEAGRSTR